MKLNEMKRQEKTIGEGPDIFERFENLRYFHFIKKKLLIIIKNYRIQKLSNFEAS